MLMGGCPGSRGTLHRFEACCCADDLLITVRPGSQKAGLLAGLIGGVVQTAISRGVGPRLPARVQPEAFVPEEFVRWLEMRLGIRAADNSEARRQIALLLHLTYGTLLGGLYARTPLPERLPAWTAGSIWGVLAWVAGFEGWLPAFGITRRTTSRPVPQWIAPILGHISFGITVAATYRLYVRARP